MRQNCSYSENGEGPDNLADPSGGTPSADSLRPGVLFNIDGVINMDQDGNPQGVFRDSGDGSTTDRADDFIPGIPGLEGSTDNMAAEILTFIEFPEAGYYTMIFNSDDGFLVSRLMGQETTSVEPLDLSMGDAVQRILFSFCGYRARSLSDPCHVV